MHLDHEILNSVDVPKLRADLLTWFQSHGRHFPWRNTRDLYKILIAEKLVQQTAVREYVVEVYTALAERYPNPTALSSANEQDLAQRLSGLGLNYRASELKRLALSIVEKFEGVVPTDLTALQSLPGVGPYSARAVLSIGLGKNYGVVDTNVARILFRVLGIKEKMPSNPARNRQLLAIMDSLVPTGSEREFNLGLIDLGALVCLPKQPHCNTCPIALHCKYFASLPCS